MHLLDYDSSPIQSPLHSSRWKNSRKAYVKKAQPLEKVVKGGEILTTEMKFGGFHMVPDDKLPCPELHDREERLEGDEGPDEAGERGLPRPPRQFQLPFQLDAVSGGHWRCPGHDDAAMGRRTPDVARWTRAAERRLMGKLGEGSGTCGE
ncbi:hypothetical protein BHE74_00009699 [Ensete ventricosum]|nr:hypothetical protein GW17_00050860 [Ensete ventricosum]RWW81868.1 hypothetical protein BHE74_00009699 [Ensete ventricosum]